MELKHYDVPAFDVEIPLETQISINNAMEIVGSSDAVSTNANQETEDTVKNDSDEICISKVSVENKTLSKEKKQTQKTTHNLRTKSTKKYSLRKIPACTYKDTMVPITTVYDGRLDRFFETAKNKTSGVGKMKKTQSKKLSPSSPYKRKGDKVSKKPKTSREVFESRYKSRLNRHANSFFEPLRGKWLSVYDRHLGATILPYSDVCKNIDRFGDVKILIQVLKSRKIRFKGLVGAQRNLKETRLPVGEHKVYVGGEHVFGKRKCSKWGPCEKDKYVE